MSEHTPEQLEAHCGKLWGSQWVDVVNHDNCYSNWDKEEAINHAVKLAEDYMRINFDAYAATLRQQGEAKAGVTDEVVQRACVAYDGAEDRTYYGIRRRFMRAALEAVWPQAALAQGKQNEAVAEVGMYWELHYVGNDPISKIVDRTGLKIGDKLYTHAERARVPKDLVSAGRSLKRLASVVRKYGTCAPGALEDVADSILAVAAQPSPSQPEDAA